MEGELSVGIAGLGKMGIAHLAILNALEGARVVAMAETRGIVRRGVGTVIPSVACYERFEEMLDREDLDAVFVASPTSMHVGMAEACLRRGLHLFVEKPLGVTGSEAEHLIPLVSDSGTVSMVGYCKHFIETFAKAREVLSSGLLGEPIYFNSHMYVSQLFRSGTGWRYKKESSGGGVLNILATHLVDILLWFFGDVDSVTSRMKSYYSGEVEDFAHAFLSFRGGVEGSLDASWSVRDYRLPEIEVEVQCAGGSLVVTDDFLKYRTDADGGFHQFYMQDLYRGVEVHVGGPEYAREDRHFLDCARSGSPTGIDLVYGYAVQRVTDAMYRSAREGRTVAPGVPG